MLHSGHVILLNEVMRHKLLASFFKVVHCAHYRALTTFSISNKNSTKNKAKVPVAAQYVESATADEHPTQPSDINVTFLLSPPKKNTTCCI